MEGFLYSLGLKGNIAKYVTSLANGGFRSPDDLLLEEPSMEQLLDLGITNEEDRQKIFQEINPEQGFGSSNTGGGSPDHQPSNASSYAGLDGLDDFDDLDELAVLQSATRGNQSQKQPAPSQPQQAQYSQYDQYDDPQFDEPADDVQDEDYNSVNHEYLAIKAQYKAQMLELEQLKAQAALEEENANNYNQYNDRNNYNERDDYDQQSNYGRNDGYEEQDPYNDPYGQQHNQHNQYGDRYGENDYGRGYEEENGYNDRPAEPEPVAAQPDYDEEEEEMLEFQRAKEEYDRLYTKRQQQEQLLLKQQQREREQQAQQAPVSPRSRDPYGDNRARNDQGGYPAQRQGYDSGYGQQDARDPRNDPRQRNDQMAYLQQQRQESSIQAQRQRDRDDGRVNSYDPRQQQREEPRSNQGGGYDNRQSYGGGHNNQYNEQPQRLMPQSTQRDDLGGRPGGPKELPRPPTNRAYGQQAPSYVDREREREREQNVQQTGMRTTDGARPGLQGQVRGQGGRDLPQHFNTGPTRTVSSGNPWARSNTDGGRDSMGGQGDNSARTESRAGGGFKIYDVPVEEPQARQPSSPNRGDYQRPERPLTRSQKDLDHSNPSSPPHSPRSANPSGLDTNERKLVPIQGRGIQGVQLVQGSNAMVSQVEALKALASQGKMPTFGNELSITVLDPQYANGEMLFLVRLTTNMKQFSHLTFHRLDVLRKFEDFEALYKKISGLSNYGSILPKFPKKKGKENVQPFSDILNAIARDPGLNKLSCFVDFFATPKATGKDANSTLKTQSSKGSGFFGKKEKK